MLEASWNLPTLTKSIKFVELRQFVEETEGSTQEDYLCLLTYISGAGYKQTLAEVGLYNALADEFKNERNRDNSDIKIIKGTVTCKELLVKTIKLTSAEGHRDWVRLGERSGGATEWRKEGQEVLFYIGGDCAIKCHMCRDGKARAVALVRQSSSLQTSSRFVGGNERITIT